MKKRFIGRIIFIGEWLLFCTIYWFGVHGERSLQVMGRHNALLAERIMSASQELADKKIVHEKMAASLFYKEKVARENLHMAYPDEMVYYIS